MKDVPGTLRAEAVAFGSTQWNVIAACAGEDGGESAGRARAAMGELCRQYWPPIYSFVRHRGYASPDAQDLTQDFFAHLLSHRLYARADPAKGKFRSFLITLLKGFLSDANKRETSQKRGGAVSFVLLNPELDAAETHCLYEIANCAALDEERFFERQWADALVSRALEALGAEYRRASRPEIFEALQPLLVAGDHLPTHEETAARLGVPLGTLRSHLSRLRTRYRELLREEVARTVAQPGDVDEELRYLCRVLIGG